MRASSGVNRVAGVRKVRMAVGSRPKPGSTDCTCWKLRRKRPAPTKQHQRDRELRDDQRVAPPELTELAASRALAPAGAGHGRPGALQRRNQTEKGAGHDRDRDRDPEREHEDVSVETEVERHRQRQREVGGHCCPINSTRTSLSVEMNGPVDSRFRFPATPGAAGARTG